MKRFFLIPVVLIFFTGCFKPTVSEIHEDVLTIDTHCDTPMRFMRGTFDPGVRHDPHKNGSKVDFVRMKEGGLDAQFFAAFLGQGKRNKEGLEKAIIKAHDIIDSIHAVVDRNSNLAAIATTPADAYKLEKSGKRAIYIGIENGYGLGKDLSLIKNYYDMGVRYITLCHTQNNDICDSSTDSTEHDGLSEFGEKVVREMNKQNMMIDVSHISDAAFYDVINLTTDPVIASHSCARAISDNPRNMTDEMLLKLKENGGVIQLCILSQYVRDDLEASAAHDSAKSAWRKKYPNYSELPEGKKEIARRDWYAYNRKFPGPMATVADAVDHIDHIVDLIGIEYVGIGTDFDGGGGLKDCYDVSEMPEITAELVKRGYSREDIRKIWGGNFMRVFRMVNKKG